MEGGGEFVHQKKRFYTQKHQKKSMSKNGIQNRLAFLFRELWAFFVFPKKTKSMLEGEGTKSGGPIFYPKKVLYTETSEKVNVQEWC